MSSVRLKVICISECFMSNPLILDIDFTILHLRKILHAAHFKQCASFLFHVSIIHRTTFVRTLNTLAGGAGLA